MNTLMKMLVLVGLAMLLTASTAAAQVVQPQYVRPSKGAAITIAPSVTASSVAATYTTSAIFDWSAFAGVIVTANASAVGGTYTACRYGVRVQALGGTSTSGDFFLLNVANSDYRAALSQSWYVRVLPGYLRFVVGTYQANTDGQPSCTYKLTVTPLPIDYAGLLASSTASSAWYELPSEFSIPTGYAHLIIQSVDTAPALCYIRNAVTGAFNTTPRTAFRLKGESAAGAGDGGIIQLDGYTGEIRCTGGEVTVFVY